LVVFYFACDFRFETIVSFAYTVLRPCGWVSDCGLTPTMSWQEQVNFQ